MKKSKYYNWLEVNKNIIAVFNSLILDIDYISRDEFKKLEKNEFTLIDSKKISSYLNKGILVNSDEEDQKAYKILYNHYMDDCRKLDFMYLVLAQGCNLGCKYCFLENMNANWKNKKMSFDVAKTSIDKYVAHMKKNNLIEGTIMLFGGEPLINWKLFKDIISYSKR